MNFLIAPDSFKGGLKNTEFCQIMEEVLTKKGHSVKSIPLTDGGDGFVETLCGLLNGKILEARATDPNFFVRHVKYGVTENTALISVAECSGLAKTMIKDPMFTTSYGLGENIKLAKALGKRNIIVGLGGSASNDGGVGAVCALGGKFYNENGAEFVPCGGTLGEIARFDLSDFEKNIGGCKFVALADVKNPLLGEYGCSKVFAPQKGARAGDVEVLETNMRRFASLTEPLGVDPTDSGMGAAGGLGYGMRAFFKAEIKFGAEYAAEISDLETEIKNADCVITGEGRFDSTANFGKICSHVLRLAKKYRKRAVVFCGAGEKYEGADVIEINDKSMTLKENIASSAMLLRIAAIKYLGAE